MKCTGGEMPFGRGAQSAASLDGATSREDRSTCFSAYQGHRKAHPSCERRRVWFGGMHRRGDRCAAFADRFLGQPSVGNTTSPRCVRTLRSTRSKTRAASIRFRSPFSANCLTLPRLRSSPPLPKTLPRSFTYFLENAMFSVPTCAASQPEARAKTD